MVSRFEMTIQAVDPSRSAPYSSTPLMAKSRGRTRNQGGRAGSRDDRLGETSDRLRGAPGLL